MRKTEWTDEHLDDMSRRMDAGFERVDTELRAIHGRIDALQKTMIQSSVVTIAALIGLIATQL